jgi:hypothetical protein
VRFILNFVFAWILLRPIVTNLLNDYNFYLQILLRFIVYPIAILIINIIIIKAVSKLPLLIAYIYTITNKKNKTVFISYAHTSESHKSFVGLLASFLKIASLNVIYDQTHLTGGDDPKRFMINAISVSNVIILIVDEKYIERINKRGSGVEIEYKEIINKINIDSYQIIPVVIDSEFHSMKIPHELDSVLYIKWNSILSNKDKLFSDVLLAINNKSIKDIFKKGLPTTSATLKPGFGGSLKGN